ncbi:UNVERIFIED_CONTAM: hypothetical protein HDU68_002236 [Siphonaria sp. JEL0065]|nr:hypothetical protein HDU68_002236 [Siphonaria sp. JEL0065]
MTNVKDAQMKGPPAIRQLQLALSTATVVSHANSHFVCTIKDSLAQEFAGIGDFTHAATLMESTLPTISTIFGFKSVENATERFKLCTLWYAAKNLRKLREVGVQTLGLYRELRMNREEVEELEWMLK